MINLTDVPYPRLLAAHYVLGERALAWHELVDFHARAAQFSMPLQRATWGWGTVYKSTRGIMELAVDTAQRTLREAGLQRADIDTAIVCSASLPAGVAAQQSFLRAFAGILQLERAEIVGITLGRCTDLLRGIHLARSLINSAQARRILVIACDAVDDERQRMENFALFSDGAASLTVELELSHAEMLLSQQAMLSARTLDDRMADVVARHFPWAGKQHQSVALEKKALDN